MARPIKETPVIKGKDAKIFARQIANVKPISIKERKKAEEIYEKFKSIAAFSL